MAKHLLLTALLLGSGLAHADQASHSADEGFTQPLQRLTFVSGPDTFVTASNAAMQVYDPLALKLPNNGQVLVTQGQLQVELAVGQRQVHQPLGDFLSGRLKDVATLLRRSRVPVMMFSTALAAHEQLRAELGKLVGGRR